VIEAPVQPKLNTITDPFKGDPERIKFMLERLPAIITSCPSKFSNKLKADGIHRILAAGPNNKVSLHSILTDAIAIAKYPEIYEPFKAYCLLTKSYDFMKHLDLAIEWCYNHLEKHGTDWVLRSPSVKSFDDIALGKLSFKVEAAGKLRIFAIADIWTQSLFYPLHEALFRYLKGFPNDGTFDQEAAFKRCLEKSVINRSVYSVDLSSATDRLPIDLQVGILDALSGQKIGDLWKQILVERPYMIRKNDFIPEGHVYYSTGQPMGCLSSWAMLAVTHHFILQFLSGVIYPNDKGWNTDYEILGDDLVIFDTKLFQAYIELMKSLDVGINLSKSLISDHLSAFEFAKRTGVDGLDVSGLSLKQMIAENSRLGRINQVIMFARKGLISCVPLLLLTLASHREDFKLPLSDKDKANLIAPLVSLLGHMVNTNRLSLEDAVAFIVDPQDEELDWTENPSLPFTRTLHSLILYLNEGTAPITEVHPLADISDRLSLLKEEKLFGYMAQSLMLDAYSRIKLFLHKYDDILNGYSLCLVSDNKFMGGDVYRNFDDVSKAQLLSWAEWALLKDRDPQDVFDELHEWVDSFTADLPELEKAQDWSDKIDNFVSSLDYKPTSKAVKSSEIPALLKEIRNSGKLVNIPYWKIA
jgi:hypothetical protein